MYFSLATLLPVVAFASVAAAAPSTLAARGGSGSGGGSSECSTGPIQCCDTIYHDPEQISGLLGLLGLGHIGGIAGSGCSPTTIVGTGSGSDCVQQPVCCNNNSFNGVIVVGCSPITINL